jgi:hypothetical protein
VSVTKDDDQNQTTSCSLAIEDLVVSVHMKLVLDIALDLAKGLTDGIFHSSSRNSVAPWVSIKLSTSITCEPILVEIMEIMELNGHGGHVLESLR